MNQDLTTGKPSSVLWRFCLPLFGSMIFQQLYNIADSLVVGKFVSETAFAAVSNAYTLTLFFLAFSFGCNIGCSVVVARYFGAKEYNRLKTTVYTTFIATLVLCIVLMVVGLWAGESLLNLIQTPVDLMADSALYLRIYVLGLPFLFFYNVATGIFSALGDSRTPFVFLACSSLANIGVDILFVTAFNMGVAGVAWATFLCQGISCVLAVVFVFRRLRDIPTTGSVPKFSGKLLGQISMIAIPSILQQSFISVGNIFIQGIINGFGPGVIAGYGATIKLNNLFISSVTTLSNGVSNYAAQNLGAQKPERILSGHRAGLRMVWLICVPLILLYFLGGRALVSFFIDAPTQAALDSGVQFLRIVAPFYFAVGTKVVTDGILRGTGRMGSFMLSTFSDLIIRVILAYIFSKTALGSTGIWAAWPFGWTVGMILALILFRRSNRLGYTLPKGENT